VENTKWSAYHDLAWTEPIITPPEEYQEDTELFSNVIKNYSKTEVRTLLHFGCGAGGNDYTFKKYFKITGVDISNNMLEIAQHLNPDVVYYQDDMRTIDLGEYFDAVAIPDSIGYMTTQIDLQSTLTTAYKHLKPGGVLLIVTSTTEQLTENNFVYTGSREDVEITVYENNYIADPSKTVYEATFVYLIRHKGKLEIHTDSHVLGVFKLDMWIKLLKEVGFENVNQIDMAHPYQQYIFGEGEYPLLTLVCHKPVVNA